MPDLAITARFPLGVYQGHTHDGRVDPYPDTVRLLSALMHAASTGDTAVPNGDRLGPSTESLTALRWLEEHPPAAIHQPRWLRVDPTRGTKIAWRTEGLHDSGYRTRRPVAAGIAVDGEYGWLWEQAPQPVRDQVHRLCADVGCLGEADSPVILETRRLEPTHRLNPSAGEVGGVGLRVRTPMPGRISELETAHQALHPARRPSVAADRSAQTERAAKLPAPTAFTTQYRYEPLQAPAPTNLPWAEAWLFPAETARSNRMIPPDEVVSWCVTFHRMLAQRLGDDAPAIITGKYAAGAPRPANRVAVQYLAPAHVQRHDIRGPAFALLIPSGILPEDVEALEEAVRGRPALYRNLGRTDARIQLGKTRRVSTASFWPEATEGHVRVWTPSPALVPEIRRQHKGWSLADAALLSLGFVFRDQLDPIERGFAGYLAMTEQVRARGARVVGARLIPDSRVNRYVHKLPEGMVAQPYTAMITLGELASDTTLLAAGQSRHVGGGLLLPVDLPSGVAPAWGAS